ncbi:hypothetical protein RKD19_000055 [Streptomyces canus]
MGVVEVLQVCAGLTCCRLFAFLRRPLIVGEEGDQVEAVVGAERGKVVVGELGLHGCLDLVVPVTFHLDGDLGHGLIRPPRCGLGVRSGGCLQEQVDAVAGSLDVAVDLHLAVDEDAAFGEVAAQGVCEVVGYEILVFGEAQSLPCLSPVGEGFQFGFVPQDRRGESSFGQVLLDPFQENQDEVKQVGSVLDQSPSGILDQLAQLVGGGTDPGQFPVCLLGLLYEGAQDAVLGPVGCEGTQEVDGLAGASGCEVVEYDGAVLVRRCVRGGRRGVVVQEDAGDVAQCGSG